MSELPQAVIDLCRKAKILTRPMITILRYFVYSKKNDLKTAFAEGGALVEAMKIILEGIIHEKQPIRKEAGKAITYMLEVDYQ